MLLKRQQEIWVLIPGLWGAVNGPVTRGDRHLTTREERKREKKSSAFGQKMGQMVDHDVSTQLRANCCRISRQHG
jgi:hypothetical protein